MSEKEDTKERIVVDEDVAARTAPPTSPQSSSAYTTQKTEWTQRMIERTITAMKNQNRQSDAEQISRILVDLSESRLTAAEAERLTTQIAIPQTNNEATRTRSQPPQPETDENGFRNACLLLFTLIVICVAVATNNPESRTAPASTPSISRNSTASPAPRVSSSGQNWQTLDVSQEHWVHSRNAGGATTFLLQNSSTAPVDVYWLDYQGKRVKYLTAAPGTLSVQHTYVGHPWLITNTDGKPIKLIIAGNQPKQAAINVP